MCTAALVSDVRLVTTFVVYESTKAADVFVAAAVAADAVAGQATTAGAATSPAETPTELRRNTRRSIPALPRGGRGCTPGMKCLSFWSC
jgi:hypothetical protein